MPPSSPLLDAHIVKARFTRNVKKALNVQSRTLTRHPCSFCHLDWVRLTGVFLVAFEVELEVGEKSENRRSMDNESVILAESEARLHLRYQSCLLAQVLKLHTC